MIDYSQLCRALGPACRAAGVAHGAISDDATADDATADDASELLDQLLEAVEASRPAPERGQRARARSAQAERVAELAAAGQRDPEIAAELGITVDAVRATRRRHGIEGQGVYVPEGSGWEERVRALHARGLANDQIAAETGWSLRTVQQRLWRLRLRANGRARRGDHSPE